MKSLLRLYLAGLKIGAFSFGGGYAMIPLLRRETVERRGWLTEEEMLDFYALAQCLPGLIMINTLALTGRKKAGAAGAVAAALGAITPALVIITVIAAVLTGFADAPVVKNAFAGIRVCVCVLVFNSVCSLWKNSVKDRLALAVFLLVAAGSVFLPLSPVVYVLLAAAAGLLLAALKGKGAA